MKWVAISGSWRNYDAKVETDVRQAVEAIIADGEGIVTGGALGVDYIATETALNMVDNDRQLRVILPTSLATYASHYRRRAKEGVITLNQAEALLRQLEDVRALGQAALVAMDYEKVDQSSYYARNGAVINLAKTLLAFQVNRSAGTQDAIDKARARGLEIRVKQYEIS